MTQSSQSLNAKAHETLENLEAKFTSQNIVKFGELATSSCKKGEAARLFYDVLLLSTKNKIKVKQDRPFGDIQLSASTVLVQ
jgi:chromatin segregation and condensation protein Rec8/ScpA/Scc1 (kleisin family)